MVTITVTPELERTVTEQAQQQGTTPELLALDALRERFTASPPAPLVVEGETMADYLKEFIGCVDSSEIYPEGSRLSENIGRRFAELMAKERYQTRL